MCAFGFYGGIAQLARAFGSYPTGRRFKSYFRYHHHYDAGRGGLGAGVIPAKRHGLVSDTARWSRG